MRFSGLRHGLLFAQLIGLAYGASVTNAQAPETYLGPAAPGLRRLVPRTSRSGLEPRPRDTASHAPVRKSPPRARPLDEGLFLLPFRSQRWPAVTKAGRFGSRRRYGWHDGVDFAVPYRTPVYAARAGRVIRAAPYRRRRDYGKGYGGLVIVRHPDGSLTWYAHLDRVYVRVGDKVTHATRLGLTGGKNNGCSSGPHLHFMVLLPDGRAVNPSIAVGRTPSPARKAPGNHKTKRPIQ